MKDAFNLATRRNDSIVNDQIPANHFHAARTQFRVIAARKTAHLITAG
jgi:hypothetical protein